jgi:hypothetical protein
MQVFISDKKYVKGISANETGCIAKACLVSRIYAAQLPDIPI